MDWHDDPRISQFLDSTFGSEKFSPKISFFELQNLFSSFNNQFKKRGVRIVSIAGTNGKGETAHTLHYLCKERRTSSLMWTSPHILTVRERFQSSAGPISALGLLELFDQVKGDLGDQLAKLSYYEFLFYVFCQWAINLAPTVLILEVGLGGRLDAINVLDPSLCLLTSIGRDHVELLGPTYQAILAEKLGITRPFVPLLSTLRLQYCRQMVQQHAQAKEIPWVDFFDLCPEISSWPYFKRNHLLGFAALEILSVPDKAAEIGVTNLPQIFKTFQQKSAFPIFQARREQMTLGDKRFIFIGAHNIEGMRELAAYFEWDREAKVEEKGQCLFVSFSKREESEVRVMLRQLLSISSIEKIIVSSFEHTKAFEQNDLKAIVTEYTEAQKRRATAVHKDCPEAGCVGKGTTIEWCENWQHWIETETANGPIFVVGSYYFIAAVQDFILHPA